MWIMNQMKNRIINSDQIIDIFINRTGTEIMAETVIDNRDHPVPIHFTLGEYKDRDTCLKVLWYIAIVNSSLPVLAMPLGGEVDTWINDISEIAVNEIVYGFVKK